MFLIDTKIIVNLLVHINSIFIIKFSKLSTNEEDLYNNSFVCLSDFVY